MENKTILKLGIYGSICLLNLIIACGGSDSNSMKTIYGIPGTVLQEEMKKSLKQLKPSGIILMGRNIETTEQTIKLTQDLRSTLGENLMICIDCEGGVVNRLKFIDQNKNTETKTPNVLTNMQSAEYFGELYKTDPKKAKQEIYTAAYTLGGFIKKLGITHNLAPIVDLSCDSLNKNQRSFSSNEEVVIGLAEEFIRAMFENGIVSVLKHLPGLHLLTNVDTHEGIARSTSSQEEIDEHLKMSSRLCGYIRKLGVKPCVMVNHGIYEGIHSKISASLDIQVYEYMSKILGEDVIFITDDLNMQGVSNHLDFFLKSVKKSKQTIWSMFCHELTEEKNTKNII